MVTPCHYLARSSEMTMHLFNEQGAGAVSTNHAAAALSMSPGNLAWLCRLIRDGWLPFLVLQEQAKQE